RLDGVQGLRKTAKVRPGQLVQLDDVEIRVLAWNPDAEPDA
ncbi:RNA-binding protein, partial [Xanthomonas perforans]|nr:RNA-binding protein [Xanthomonas perforans]